MSSKKTRWRDPEVGASKVAKGILGSLDRRLVEPAGIIIRFWGWVLLVGVSYLTYFNMFPEPSQTLITGWLVSYFLYLTVLELARKILSSVYDSYPFRIFRIVFNILAITTLVLIASTGQFLVALAYTVPIFAAIVYFSEIDWAKFGTFILAILGLYVGGIKYAISNPLNLMEFTLISFVLAFFSYTFDFFRKRVNLVPGRLSEIAKELHTSLDLQQLMVEILEKTINITQAQRGLIIIINPRNKKYVGHSLHNFNLKANRSIEDLAKKCSVLVNETSFENPDIVSAFDNKSIYHEFFDTQPRSVLAEPFYNRAGQVIGVINVGHDTPNGFYRTSKILLREFAFLVSNSIENCFEHREIILREAKSREVGEKFVSTNNEDQAMRILIDEIRQQIPNADKLTLHKYLPEGGDLLPIYSFSPEITPNLLVWSNPHLKGIKPDLRLGYGIAGRALELRDTILVHDTESHPWFARLNPKENIKSLLVAPLFHSEGQEGDELYGTLSLESTKPNAFNLDDESTLTYLSAQTSRVIAKIRDFQAWRERGGVFERILEQIGKFDIKGEESKLCQQITDSAVALLGFKIARLRLLSKDDLLVTHAVTGVSKKTEKKILSKDLPYSKLKPFLNKDSKAGGSYLIKRNTPGWKGLVDEYFHKPYKKSNWDAYDALVTPLHDALGETVGLLTLDSPITGSEPNKQTIELIGVFASVASWMLELSRYQRRISDQKNRTKSFIYTISQELAKCRDVPAISEVVVQAGSKLLSAEGCSLHIVHDGFVELTHSNYLSDTEYKSRKKPISSKRGAGLTAYVASTGKTLCLKSKDFENHEAWGKEEGHLKYLPSKRCDSVLISPIIDKEGKVIGVINLENKRGIAGPKDFDNDDVERLQILANEFSKALEVIGLYEDVKAWERTGLAEDIHDLINWHHSGVIDWIEAMVVWLKRGNIEKVNELLPQVRENAFAFLQELRILHTNFRDESFEYANFKQSLELTLSAWTKQMTPKYEKEKMKVIFDCPENLEIPAKIRNTIIRFASLAFSNAIRHSGISENPRVAIFVTVEKKQGTIVLTVNDTGYGFDRKKTPPGYGFDRMKQLSEKINRWETLSATFQIETKINYGTKVTLSLVPKAQ